VLTPISLRIMVKISFSPEKGYLSPGFEDAEVRTCPRLNTVLPSLTDPSDVFSNLRTRNFLPYVFEDHSLPDFL